ncbi:MAG: radical SAM protein [Bacteroidia bacterium]|nr:radical SAM protein [Bacteroidia bacterium]
MKLTIIHPCIGREIGKDYIKSWQMEPLPAAYLAALTPKDIEIAFYDDRMEKIPYDEPTDLVAISVETYTAKRSYQIATEYRRRNIPVVMGGFHATLVPEEVMQYAEAVVIGEAEQIWPQVIEDFKNGTMNRTYRQQGRSDISHIMPDRSIFKNKKYLNVRLIEASRGCIFKCNFCAVTAYFEGSQTRRCTDTIIQEIKQINDRKSLYFFVDDNSVASPKEAKKFYEALKPLKIRWVSQASINMTYDDELLQIMKDSGCQGVLIGFESLNHENLDSMNKTFNYKRGGFTPAIQQLNKFGIGLYATFLFGYDNDTLDTFKQTSDFCIKNRIFMAAFNHLTPFPGTPLYNQLEKEGKLLYEKWWLNDNYFYGHVPFKTKLPPEEIKRECFKARKAFYSLRSILYRMFNPIYTRSFFMLGIYWLINLMLRGEGNQREGYPLGDPLFQGELLPVAEADRHLHEKLSVE